jgi:hypothetical protein
MEDVLAVYQRPHDPDRPVVCLDETTKQLIKETRVPVSAKPGQPARHDYEYERNCTANLFMLFAPLEGWRHVEVTDRHAALDYAQILKDLSDRHFPHASKIVLVQDNLSTHKPASLYEAFPAAEARRLVERFEWHYTPKHGSWLDMAETELSVLSRQCLDRRIPNKQVLIEEATAWQEDRNKNHAKADWQFTTADARIKLKRLSQLDHDSGNSYLLGSGKSLKILASARENQRKPRAVPTKSLAKRARALKAYGPCSYATSFAGRTARSTATGASSRTTGCPAAVRCSAMCCIWARSMTASALRGAGRSRHSRRASKPDRSRCSPRIGRHRH